VGQDRCIVLLGDNLFETSLQGYVQAYREQERGARLLLVEQSEEEHLQHLGVGVMEAGKLVRIVEKPANPPSRLAVSGLYGYDQQVWSALQTLRPSARGELEVTDLNNWYLARGEMQYDILAGWWGDAGESIETYEAVNKTFTRSRRASGRQRVVVMPAYYAARTLPALIAAIPPGAADTLLLVDDASGDATAAVARSLGVRTLVHPRNLGYGGNQKTCYTQALALGAQTIIMLHPDGQYDPALLPALAAVIESGEADIVLGSRWLRLAPADYGMPIWKRLGNRFLTAAENMLLGLHLSEYHTGYRAYSAHFLRTIPFLANSNDFVFDTQVLLQAVAFGFKIAEIPAVGLYHSDASSINFRTSVVYGLKTLVALFAYRLHLPVAWLRPAPPSK
jgi:hypothetical protein